MAARDRERERELDNVTLDAGWVVELVAAAGVRMALKLGEEVAGQADAEQGCCESTRGRDECETDYLQGSCACGGLGSMESAS